MKSYKYWSMLLLPFALAACSSESVEEPDYGNGDYINFAPEVRFGEVETTTRSEIIHEIFPEGAKFGVLGYCIPATRNTGAVTLDYKSGIATWNDKRPFLCADMFYKQEVIVRGGQCSYNYNNTGLRRKWYKPGEEGVPTGTDVDNYKYSFFAYYPYDKHFIVTSPDKLQGRGAPKLQFTMPFSADGEATTSRDHAEVKDAMVALVYNVTRNTAQVPLYFRHLLTGIRFRINNFDADHALTIESISLEGRFFRSAELDFTTPANEGKQITNINDTYRGRFEVLGGTSINCPGNASIIAGETADSPEGTTILLLPNPNANPDVSDGSLQSYYLGAEKYINISYRFAGDTETQTQRIEVGELSYQAKNSTRYTANLNFIHGQFVLVFSAAINGNWDEDFNNEIIIS